MDAEQFDKQIEDERKKHTCQRKTQKYISAERRYLMSEKQEGANLILRL